MKFISKKEADEHLASIGMRIGEWNEVAIDEDRENRRNFWVNYAAPTDARELLSFAQHAAGWVPGGKWKILQIDNSTCLDAVQENYVGRLLYGPEHRSGLGSNRTILFEFCNDFDVDRGTELLISDLVFAFFLFQCHAYLVSSDSTAGEILGIQDGFAYFLGNEACVARANGLLEIFKGDPLLSPTWIAR